nr:hypothetical protein [Tanacetum cinerariifolium]
MLIPGPKSPAKDIDVFLQPLIRELQTLWSGVWTRDTGTDFKMKAALFWTINDFPAQSSFSWWSGQGYLACPTCNKDTSSAKVRGKIVYVGHRKFLRIRHTMRMKRTFNGKIDMTPIPKTLTNADIMNQLRVLPRRVPRKHSSNKQKPRDRNVEFNWNKRSIFYNLDYWPTLQLKHNLDVMHIEKNVLESLLGTLLMNDKSKDTIKARQDLEVWGIRKELWLVEKGRGKFKKPHPKYSFTPDNRKKLCQFIKGVRLPDGFGSSFKKKVTVDDNNITGMKSHDCHIMMQRLLPYGVQQYLPKDISPAIIELYFLMEFNNAYSFCYAFTRRGYSRKFPNNNLEAEFPRWFDLQIRQKSVENDPRCSPESELFSLACGPELKANSYAACVVNGVKFLVHDRDIHRTTQSSGVATPGPNGEMFYGQLEEILELTYIGNRKVVLFRCKWFDTRNPPFARSDHSKRCYIKQKINHILTDKDSYRDQQYILATHTRQVFYLEDLARRPPHWKIVEDVHHCKIWHRDVVEDDQDVIHDSKSSDVALSANLGDLDYTSLSTNDESTEVDASPDNETYALLVYCTSGYAGVNTFGIKRGFLSQKGSGVGRGVKEKQVSIADKSIEVSKHANVVNTGLDSFLTISEVHGIHFPACNEENMNDVGSRVGPTPAGNTPGMSSYANVTGGLSRKDMNFRTLSTLRGNEADMVVLVESVRAISERFANTAYGFFLEKRVSYLVVANYVRNTWGKYGLVKSMLNSSTGIFSFQFSSMKGLDSMLEIGWFESIATNIGTPLMLDSYTPDMCNQSWGRSSYARALIEVQANVELKDNILVVMLELVGEGFYTCNVRVEYVWKPSILIVLPLLLKKNDKIKRLIIDGTATLVDDKGKPLTKVNSLGDHDSEDEVASESYEDGEYDYDPYDDDMYEGQDIPNMIQDICDNLDIKVRGLFEENTRDLDSIGEENGTKTQPYKISVKDRFTARGDCVANPSDAINVSSFLDSGDGGKKKKNNDNSLGNQSMNNVVKWLFGPINGMTISTNYMSGSTGGITDSISNMSGLTSVLTEPTTNTSALDSLAEKKMFTLEIPKVVLLKGPKVIRGVEESVLAAPPSSYDTKLSLTSLIKANLRKLDASVLNDADCDLWGEPKTTPSVGDKNVPTSGFFLSYSFEALNVENLVIEEAKTGNKASASGVKRRGNVLPC